MAFTVSPKAEDMVTQVSDINDKAICLLCIRCEWEGTAVVPDAPWVIFQTHKCRLSVADHIAKD